MTTSAQQGLKRELITRLAIGCSTWDEICQLADWQAVNKTECFFSGIGTVTPQDITNECHRLLNRAGLPYAPVWARYVALDRRLLRWHWFDKKPCYDKKNGEWFPLTSKSRFAFAGTAIALPAGYNCELALFELKSPAPLKKSIFRKIKSMLKKAIKCAN